MTHRFTTSVFALSAALATPALADVSPADVWANQQAFFAATGGTLSGDLGDDGTVTPELNFILPDGVASLQITSDPISLTDDDNGGVMITYPSPMTITMAGGAQGEGSFSTEVVMTHGGYTSIATGDAGDIAYDTNGSDLRIEVTDLTVDGAAASDFAMTGFLTMTGWTNQSKITEGNLITYSSESTTGESNAEFVFEVDNITSTSTQMTLPLQTVIQASLPVGGSDVMNLSQALRDGLSVVMASTGEGSSSTSQMILNGEVMNQQDTVTGPQTATVAFNEDGLKLEAEAEGFEMLMNDPLVFPGDLEFAVAEISANYDIPLNASDDMQDFRMATSLSGLTMGDAIWNLFDPTGGLPRDPAEVTFDITGTGTSGIDLLDFAAMSQMFGPPPIEVDEVTIKNLYISAVGAEATAKGAMTFDWSDFDTIPGIPRPEGAVTINLNGANQLMDTLVELGFIPAEDLMMPRMMMGMFATPTGDDMLESVIEVNDQGHVLANGQRLQ